MRAWLRRVAVLGCLAGSAGAHAADFDGDGHDDLFWRNGRTGANVVWRSALVGAHTTLATVANDAWQVVGAGDFDGDGRDDLLWRHRATGANTAWRGADAGAPLALPRVADPRWIVAGVGDFDGDGRDDLFWRHLGTGADAVWPAADARRRRTLPTVPVPDWMVAGIGDFDGDGRDDVLWRNVATGANVVWDGAAANRRRAIASMRNLDWQVEAIGDYDGDHRDDVFWRHTGTGFAMPSGGTASGVTAQRASSFAGSNLIWRSADAATLRQVATVDDPAWQVAASGDFDGDGRDDLLWRHYATGANVAWRSALRDTPRAVAPVRDDAWRIAPYEAQPVRPVVTLADVALDEGDGGTRRVMFVARLSHASLTPAHYLVGTASGSRSGVSPAATAGADYVEVLGEGRLAPTQLDIAFPVDVRGDTAPEANEAFQGGVQLDVPNAVANGFATIRNDDANTLWIEDASAHEGDSGTRTMVFTVRLSRPAPADVGYAIATADNHSPPQVFDARAGVDYQPRALAGEAIPAGATARTFAVTIIGDTLEEILGESFRVDVGRVSGAVVVDAQASGHIVDDDGLVVP